MCQKGNENRLNSFYWKGLAGIYSSQFEVGLHEVHTLYCEHVSYFWKVFPTLLSSPNTPEVLKILLLCDLDVATVPFPAWNISDSPYAALKSNSGERTCYYSMKYSCLYGKLHIQEFTHWWVTLGGLLTLHVNEDECSAIKSWWTFQRLLLVMCYHSSLCSLSIVLCSHHAVLNYNKRSTTL